MTTTAHSDIDPRRRFCKVRQACDSCRARKIRCDGLRPCANCLHVNCACTYLAVPKKTGPKGRRKARPVDARAASYFSTVLPSAVRASTGLAALSGLSGLSGLTGLSGLSGLTSRNVAESVVARQHPRHVPISPKQTPSPSPPPPNDGPEASLTSDGGDFIPSPRVTRDMMLSCLDAFFTYKYSITPILDRHEVRNAVLDLQHQPEMYGLITACCAVMVLSPDIISLGGNDKTAAAAATSSWPPRAQESSAFAHHEASSDVLTAQFFISETIRARSFCDCVERPSLTTVQTSFFLFSAFFCLGKDTSAWHYLRQAITVLQSLRLHEEATYTGMTDAVAARYTRRMFWVLFITERAYALQRHRPLTLQDAIDLPSTGRELGEEKIMSGLLDLISLFRNFDSDFLTMWNTPDGSHVSGAAREYPAKLQRFLQSAIPEVAARTANQQADLILSREWLKIVVWQLCVSKTLLCSSSPLESMSFQFPVSVARNVVVATSRLPMEALEANGVGILEKIFDVGCSLADVLSVNPHCVPRTALQVSPADYLKEMVRLVGTVAGGSPRHLRVLAAKAEECLRTSALYMMTLDGPPGSNNRSAPASLMGDGYDDEDECRTGLVRPLLPPLKVEKLF
ncbi:hypothetical protein E4U42_000054 [Claviceps africana]|uniref:Zn(2)-C6 fungal-type domain-containing protein n=1 Tax=Claviceps africana TaxID=83212 RepID=A0A8K0NKW3_9HYPO|nr:hypothetical protein E4U42_000054 [Claviceps africana]